MKRIFTITTVVFCFLALALICEQYYRLFRSNIVSRDNESHLIYIYPQTDLDSLISVLSDNYDISSKWNFRFHARLMKFSSPKVGCYMLSANEGDLNVLRRLRAGEQTPIEVSFNHIRTTQQLAKCLSNQLLLDSVSIITRLQSDSFMTRYGLNKETAVCLFIPNTYEMYWTISADALFDKMNKEYSLFWNQKRCQKAASWGLSNTDVAILASIAEEETNKDFEYPIIAGLYYNRLKKKMPLQACPTIKFAWQDFSLRRILLKHLEIESPYNTYKNIGLPPGPIRIPRAATMDAVLNMQPSNYLFMCASAEFNGTHHFSSTYAEHSRYAKIYQAELNKRGIK